MPRFAKILKKNNAFISQHTLITGLFGYPVRHTLSPAMQNAAFAACGLPHVYLPFEVHPDCLKEAVAAVRALGMAGVNVTIPHKETAMALLDRVDAQAKKIGSINTIVNRNGGLTGFNTDAPGFLADITEKGCDPAGATAVLIGSGGAAKAVSRALIDAGLKKLYITSDDARQGAALADRLPRSSFVPLNGWKKLLPQAGLLVNATPVGMKPSDPALATAEDLHRGLFVYDLIYLRPTPLILAARAAGARYADGLGMLLHQGALSFEHWTGRHAPRAAMQAALIAAFKQQTAPRAHHHNKGR